MLKTRLIPCLLLQNGLLVRSEEFRTPPGRSATRSTRSSASARGPSTSWSTSTSRARARTTCAATTTRSRAARTCWRSSRRSRARCFVPLTFGGGIRTLEDVRARIARGADKVDDQHAGRRRARRSSPRRPARSAARRSWSRSTPASARRRLGGDDPLGRGTRPGSTSSSGRVEAERRGAGEIFLNSVDRDGMAGGYDLRADRARSATATRDPGDRVRRRRALQAPGRRRARGRVGGVGGEHLPLHRAQHPAGEEDAGRRRRARAAPPACRCARRPSRRAVRRRGGTGPTCAGHLEQLARSSASRSLVSDA